MGTSKVSLFGDTLIDLRNVTVTSDHLVGGQAHDKYGDIIEGAARPYANEEKILKRSWSGAYINNIITRLGERAFSDQSNMTTFSAANVKTVSSYVFSLCSKLVTVSLPEVTTIGSNAFASCTALTTFVAPKIITISASAFNGCTKLANSDFSNAETIGTSAFKGAQLKNCNFNPISIGDQGFRDATYFEVGYFPRLVTITDTYALAGCYSTSKYSTVTSVVMPKLTTLGTNNAISYSSVILSIDLTAVSSIPAQTFRESPSFNTLILRKNSLVTLDNINAFTNTAFASGKTGGTLYVPSSLIASYQSATNWSTILGYANNHIQSLEGSQYEHYYPDGEPVQYYINKTLTNITSSNSATRSIYLGSYTTTLTADMGYALSSVEVLMNGIDVTSSVYSSSTGEINIDSTLGDIVITATATQIQYNWDYEWNYTDGIPTDYGWTESKWNSGATATMTESGFKLESPNSTNICYLKNDYIMNSGVMEVTLSETFNTSTAYGNACIALSNGTSAIVFCSPKGQGAIRNNSSYASCTTIGYTIPSATDITVRLAIDGMKGNISIDGLVKWRTDNISTATYAGSGWALYTRFGSESQQSGYSTIIKSVKLKNLSNES